MADGLLDHLTALKAFLNASPAQTPDALSRHKAEVLKKIEALPHVSLHDATRIANVLQNFLQPENQAMLETLNAKVRVAEQEAAVHSRGYRSLQNWQTFPYFLFQKHWDMILDTDVPRPVCYEDVFF
ncbi:MAG: hypothetical protein OIF54_14175 [Cohaesibacter sp.]|nr:hypothetical protein [Cohaesibacter sp.]